MSKAKLWSCLAIAIILIACAASFLPKGVLIGLAAWLVLMVVIARGMFWLSKGVERVHVETIDTDYSYLKETTSWAPRNL